jgi:hypothetical protein
MGVKRSVQSVLIGFLVLGLVGPLFAKESLETKPSLSGYYRARGIFLNHYLAGGESADYNLAYFEHRLRLNPELRIGEKAWVRAQMDFPDDQVFGDPGLTAFSETNALSDLSIKVKRAYGEAALPFFGGRISAGRMGFDWGRGILFNSGDRKVDWGDPHYGDNYDQVLVDLRPRGEGSDLHLVAAVSKLSEGDLEYWYDGKNDDLDRYLLAAQYRTDFLKGGLLLAGVHQSAISPGLVPEITEGTQVHRPSTGTDTLTADLHGKIDLVILRMELELIYRYGETKGMPQMNSQVSITYPQRYLHQFGWVYEVGLKIDPLEDFALEFGGADGDSVPDDSDLTAFSFDPNYQVSLLLFQEVLRRDREIQSQSVTDALSPNSFGLEPNQLENVKALWEARYQTRGAVANAFYVKPTLKVKPLEDLTITFSYLWARARVGIDRFGDGKARYGLGSEFDLGAEYRLVENATLGVQAGYLITGDYFDYQADGSINKALPAAAIQSRFTINF